MTSISPADPCSHIEIDSGINTLGVSQLIAPFSIKMTLISLVLLAFVVVSASSSNETDLIRIVNSGSTNTAAYTIELQRNGLVQWMITPRFQPVLSSSTSSPNRSRIPTVRAKNIFQEIEQAFPFTQYEPVFCIKSISFGTTLSVVYNGQQSPDFNCPMKDQRLVNLSKDIHELITDLHINTLG